MGGRVELEWERGGGEGLTLQLSGRITGRPQPRLEDVQLLPSREILVSRGLSVRLSQFIDRLDSQIPNWYESDGKRAQRPPKTLFFLLTNFKPIYATQLEAVRLAFCRQRKRGSLRLGDNPVAIAHKNALVGL